MDVREEIEKILDNAYDRGFAHGRDALDEEFGPDSPDDIIAIVKEALLSEEAIEAAGIGWVSVFADSPPLHLEPGEGIAAEDALKCALATAFGPEPTSRQEEEQTDATVPNCAGSQAVSEVRASVRLDGQTITEDEWEER